MEFLLMPHFICFCLFLPLLTTAQTNKNITIGSSLVAGGLSSSSWTSPSRDFAFGFQEIQPGNFLLAIWFDALPDHTITWSANRNNLVPKGSKVQLTSDKGLVLSDPSGREIWRAKMSSSDRILAYGAMLDTGNFVLATQGSAMIWQSFDEPTDTVLPTQVLNQGSQLIARYSAKNYSSGRFMMQLGTDGNFGLYTTNYPLFDSTNTVYFPLSTQGSGYQVLFNQSGHLYLVGKNGTILYELLSDNVSELNFYQRVILEYDGVLRHYVYPKNQPSQSVGWSTKSFIPENICVAAIQQTGSGVCGYNSYCQLGDDQRPYCSCPPGYTFLDPNNQMSGCSQDFPPQSCGDPSQDTNLYDFKVLVNVDWPLSDYEHYENVTKDWCGDICLRDCLCAVSVFGEGGHCWKKKLPLSNGRNDTSVGRTAFIKVMKKRNKNKPNEDYAVGAERGDSCLEFSLEIIKVATNDFCARNKLGQGGFGAVYKGTLPNGKQIAVKRHTAHSARRDIEFKNEVQLVARLNHKNLIKLIGFSVQGNERILIYELALNGSLDHFLFDPIRREHLTWKIRYCIIEGIARGLLYFHEDSQLRIIHRDLKAGNILLDEHMTPKISDFGTARLFIEDQGSASQIVGTYGYMPPEYAKHGKVSVKVDIFSFGVLLLEIVCGKKNSASKNHSHIEHLLSKAWMYWTKGNLVELIDPILLRSSGHTDEITRCMQIGLLCVQEDAACRPTMDSVILMLEGRSQSLAPPLKPAYFMLVENESHDHKVEQNSGCQTSVGSLHKPCSGANEVSITQPYPEPR